MGAAIDILDPHGLELMIGGVEAVAVLHGMHNLMQKRGDGVASHGSGRLAAAAAFQLGP
jgi:hypothetical protein